jgi:hypothetical protein
MTMKHAWYHCGHCGSLFQSALGLDEERLCADCGRKPGTGIWPVVEARPPERELPAFEKKGRILDNGGKRTVRKKRGKGTMVKILVVWLVLVILVVWPRVQKARAAKERESLLRAGKGNLAEGTMADERIALMMTALPECHRALAGFLTGGTPEIRNQFVADPIGTAGEMAIFYQANPFPRIETKGLKRIGQEAILVGGEWVIETRWQGDDGVEFDAVFRREGKGWKLDWKHFSRYGDSPWPLFLAGEGDAESEFRLLARKVADGGEAERAGSRLRIALMSPEFGNSLGGGMASPELVVDRRSDEGLLLQAAFDAAARGESLFGGKLKPMEPDDLIRVRVRIKRGEFGGVRSFTLERVVACHWMGVDDAGFDLDKLKDELFSGD